MGNEGGHAKQLWKFAKKMVALEKFYMTKIGSMLKKYQHRKIDSCSVLLCRDVCIYLHVTALDVYTPLTFSLFIYLYKYLKSITFVLATQRMIPY